MNRLKAFMHRYSRLAYDSMTGNVLFFFVTVLLVLSSAGADGGPIWSYPILVYNDYLAFARMMDNPDIFTGTSIFTVASRVSSVTFPIQFAQFLNGVGVPYEMQHVYIYLLQTLITAVGIMLLGYQLEKSYLCGLLALAAVLLSHVSPFYDGKVLGQTMATAVGIIMIVFLISGNWIASSVIAALSGYIHPTYPYLYFLIVILTLIVCDPFINRLKVPFSKMVYCLAAFSLLAIPVIWRIITNLDAVFTPDNDVDRWCEFLWTTNILAFPWLRGESHAIGHTLTFLFAGFLMLLVSNGRPEHSRLAFIMLLGVVAYLIQIIFSTYYPIRSEFIIKLALNHRVNNLMLPVVVVVIVVTIVNGISQRTAPAWILIATFMIFIKTTLYKEIDTNSLYPSLFIRASFVRADLLAPLVAAIALILMDKSALSKKRGAVRDPLVFITSVIALASISLSVACAMIFQSDTYYLLCASIVVGLLIWSSASVVTAQIADKPLSSFWGFINDPVTRNMRAINQKIAQYQLVTGKPAWLMISMTLYFLFIVATRFPVTDPVNRWKGLLINGKGPWWSHEFIEKNVPPNERVVIVPLSGEGKNLPVIPSRAAYLESYEGHYVLYAPDERIKIENRLRAYSINPSDRDQVISDGETRSGVVHWRKNLDLFREIDPRANWVITHRKYTCGQDKIFAELAPNGIERDPINIVLLRFDGVDRSCKP